MGKPKLICVLASKDYKPGDPPPEGYLDWHEWARVQHRAGLRQVRCRKCRLLSYPQERGEEGECLKCKGGVER